MFKDLRATLLCLLSSSFVLASCSTIPQNDLARSGGFKPSLLSGEATRADLVVRKTSHSRFTVLPATVDIGAPFLTGQELRGELSPLDQAFDPKIVLEGYTPSSRALRGAVDRPGDRSGRRLAKRQVPDHLLATAVGTPRIVRAGRRLQCVPFAREASGVEIFGNANRWWDLARGLYDRVRTPDVGSVMVMNGYRTTRRGHVAVVREIVDDRTIIIDHANWLNDGKIYLSAPVKDVSPENDWSQVKVWYTPGQQWGRRIYSAKGFIRPTSQVAQR